MKQQIEKTKSLLTEALSDNDQKVNLLERLNGTVAIVDQATAALKVFLKTNHFDSNAEEIEFFKREQPEILAHKLEAGIKYNLIINKPIGTVEAQTKYLEDQLKAFQSFFKLNSFHYQYYKNGLSELDTLYFLRRAERITIPPTDLTEIDEEFATPMSFLFAKFIAYEHILYFILEQIALVRFPDIELTASVKTGAEELQWTGDVINVIELAYGLWLTGQLNHGNASLNQIVKWLETNFKVSIGIAQRKFTEIGRRKRISVTKFIDQMRDAILKKIDSDQQ